MHETSNWYTLLTVERKIFVQTCAQIGIFIDGVGWQDMVACADRCQDGLILDSATVGMLKDKSFHLPANLANRVLVTASGDDPAAIQAQAEELTLLGDNVWVQVPVMTAGRFNRDMLCHLLDEGVPLAVTGVASKQQAYQLLMLASGYSTPLLVDLCPAMSRYDAIVSVALAHLMPQVQVISKAQGTEDFWDIQGLHFDGVILDKGHYLAMQALAANAGGQACSIRTHQQYELAIE